MPNEAQEALGAAAYRVVMTSPHITYGTQFDRFGWVVPPNPHHMDCSGAVGHIYWEALRLKIGADTGAIARDVAAGKASFVHTSTLIPGDLVMRRSGRIYDGGPDEHVGMFCYRLTDGRPVTFESAGSKQGVGYYPRPTNFWRDGVRYPALLDAPPVPPARKRGIFDMRLIRDKRPTTVSNTGQMIFWYSGGWARQLDPQEVPYHQQMLKDAGLPIDPDDDDDSNHLIDRLKVTKRITVG